MIQLAIAPLPLSALSPCLLLTAQGWHFRRSSSSKFFFSHPLAPRFISYFQELILDFGSRPVSILWRLSNRNNYFQFSLNFKAIFKLQLSQTKDAHANPKPLGDITTAIYIAWRESLKNAFRKSSKQANRKSIKKKNGQLLITKDNWEVAGSYPESLCSGVHEFQEN